MLDELKTTKKIVGIKQSMKAIQSRRIKKAFIAKDADERVTGQLQQSCLDNAIQVEYAETMSELGKACGIDVGAAVAVIIDE